MSFHPPFPHNNLFKIRSKSRLKSLKSFPARELCVKLAVEIFIRDPMTLDARHRSIFLKSLFLATCVFLIYSFSMGSGFKTDDRYSIMMNPLIHDFGRAGEFFKQGYFGDRSYYRPLVYLTYAAEYHVFGENAFYYNLDNILIHIANSLLIWALVSLWLPGRVGFWAGFLFAVHPIHWEAVANISGRSVLLCTLFSLASFYALIRAFEQNSRRWLAASVAFFILALLSKEAGGVMPAVFFFYLICVRPAQLSWKRLAYYFFPFAVAVVGYLIVRKFWGVDFVYAWPTLQEQALGVLAFLRSLITHLRLMIWPVDLHFDRSQAVYTSFNNPEILYVVALWTLIIAQYWIWRRHIQPVERLCLAWMVIGLFPVSQIVAAIGVAPGYISTAEHFMYLPGIPFCILLVSLTSRMISAPFWVSHRPMQVFIAAYMIFLIVMNIQQNFYARNEVVMLEQSLAYQPYNARLQNLAGYLYAQDGNDRKAEEHFELAVRADPFNPSPRISLGKSQCDQGRFGECLVQYLSVSDPGPFGGLLNDNLRYPVEKLEAKITAGGRVSQMEWFGWGMYQSKIGQPAEAIAALENLLKMNPQHISGLILLASVYETSGDIAQARECYLKLRDISLFQSSIFNYVVERLANLRMNHPEAFR